MHEKPSWGLRKSPVCAFRLHLMLIASPLRASPSIGPPSRDLASSYYDHCLAGLAIRTSSHVCRRVCYATDAEVKTVSTIHTAKLTALLSLAV